MIGEKGMKRPRNNLEHFQAKWKAPPPLHNTRHAHLQDRRNRSNALPGANSCNGRACAVTSTLERFPIRSNHLIEKESLRFKELEHVLIEKAGQLFRSTL
jgi:hypothetical protein